MGYRGEDVSRTPADWGHQESSPGMGQGNAGSWVDEAQGYGNGDYDGYASVQYGNYGDQVYEGMLNIPIIPDELMLRVSGKREERDGFTTNIVNGQKLDNRDYWSGRVSLEWRPVTSTRESNSTQRWLLLGSRGMWPTPR